MQRPGGDLVPAQTPRPLARGLEQRARHLDQAEAAPVAGGLTQGMAAGIEAVQQRTLDRGPTRGHLVLATSPDVVRPRLDAPILLGCLLDQRAPGLVEADAAADQVVGHGGVDAELPGCIGDAGDSFALLAQDSLGDGAGGGLVGGGLPRHRLGRGRAPALCLEGRAHGAGRGHDRLGRRGPAIRHVGVDDVVLGLVVVDRGGHGFGLLVFGVGGCVAGDGVVHRAGLRAL